MKGEEVRVERVVKQAKTTEARSLVNLLNKITVAQLKVLIVPLTRNEDGAITKSKVLLIENLVECKERGILTVEEEDVLVEDEVVAESEVVTAAASAVAAEEEDNECICIDLDDWHTIV